jgi:hypothetical protein
MADHREQCERLTGVALKGVLGVVDRRAGGRCERCGRGMFVFDHHHRKLRSRGGGDSAANLVAICRRCHNWIHANPRQASVDGWMVHEHLDPATTRLKSPLWGDVYLGNDGRTSGVVGAPARGTREQRLDATLWPTITTHEGISA